MAKAKLGSGALLKAAKSVSANPVAAGMKKLGKEKMAQSGKKKT